MEKKCKHFEEGILTLDNEPTTEEIFKEMARRIEVVAAEVYESMGKVVPARIQVSITKRPFALPADANKATQRDNPEDPLEEFRSNTAAWVEKAALSFCPPSVQECGNCAHYNLFLTTCKYRKGSLDPNQPCRTGKFRDHKIKNM